MIRTLDSVALRVRAEVDELLHDYPLLTADALAERFETMSRIRTFSDPEFVRAIIGELRKRAYARVRYWPALNEGVSVQPSTLAIANDHQRGRHLELVEQQSFWWQRL